MQKALVKSVGDGLCMGLDCDTDFLHVDCGDGKHGTDALDAMRGMHQRGWAAGHLALSHFHADHLNGFYQAYAAASGAGLGFAMGYTDVHFPRVPDLPGDAGLQDEVMDALVAMHVLELSLQLAAAGYPGKKVYQKAWFIVPDVLTVLDTLCPTQVVRHPCAEGDPIYVGTDKLTVLWPPQTLPVGHRLRRKVTTFIGKFRRAASSSPLLRSIQGLLLSHDIAGGYRTQPSGEPGGAARVADVECTAAQLTALETSPEVTAARASFGDLTNSLSLAFIRHPSILFLGDAEDKDIPDLIANAVRQSGCSNLRVKLLMAAHHGTHWDNALQTHVRSRRTVSSDGDRMHPRHQSGYGAICTHDKCTHRDGEQELLI